jgi:hypothetical protein
VKLWKEIPKFKESLEQMPKEGRIYNWEGIIGK